MRDEPLKKPLFIYAQNWYNPEACTECPEFNFVLLPEGAAAFCNCIEDDRPCVFSELEDMEIDLQSTARLTLEALSPLEA
ncbi:unnamed protein product [marine sediment metagenome]|uniref:Uncharacterized protein n=1 Tax=marine sediment metagenome TaxID=412755 RepID=X0S946_9ZZZZ